MKEGLDWLQRGIANAVVDIREKVVEEPWFGKKVTPEEQTPPSQSEQQREAVVADPDPIHRTQAR